MKFHAVLSIAALAALATTLAPVASAEPIATIDRVTSTPADCGEGVTCTTSTTTLRAGVLGASASSALTTESCADPAACPAGHGHAVAIDSTLGGASLGWYAGQAAPAGASASAMDNSVAASEAGSAYSVGLAYAGHEARVVGANGDFALVLA